MTNTLETPKLRGQYILTQDTMNILCKLLCTEIKINNIDVQSIVDNYFEEVQRTLEEVLPEVQVISFREEEIESALKEKLEPHIDNEEYLIVCLDRFLLSELEGKNFTRFEITRPADATDPKNRIPRVGAAEIREQLERIGKIANGRKIVLVDDGSFSGETFNFVKALFEKKIGISVEKIISYLGGDTENCIQKFPNPEYFIDWVDMRDFSPLGGKITSLLNDGEKTSTIPYIPPFSNGAGASLDSLPEEKLKTLSNRLLKAFQEMIRQIEAKIGRPITIQDLVNQNFAIPMAKLYPKTKFPENPSQINELYGQSNPLLGLRLVDYIGYDCILANLGFKSQEWQDLKVVITDVDGTLWSQDSTNFSNSSLGKAVKEAYLNLIREKEPGSNAEEIYNQAITQESQNGGVPISQFFANRYDISREDIFEQTWGRVPVENIIKPEEKDLARKALQSLKKQGKEIYALTAAPEVWFYKVASHLELGDIFDGVYTAEDFTTKDDIMKRILNNKDLKPCQVLSIGDQPDSDLEPAKGLGIRTLQVWGPKDLVFPSL
jgi:FMN phosphatase YigB (HAD superfamily)